MSDAMPKATEIFSDANLIFIISQPRAGSTLLQSIIAGNEAVHTTAEPWFMLNPVYALREAGHTADYDSLIATRALHDHLGNLIEGEAVYLQAIQLMALHLYRTAAQEKGKSYFLDKTPRYYYILPQLQQIFPRAYFIILLRNPAAVLSSILRTWVKDDWNRLDYFRDDLLLAPRSLTSFIAESSRAFQVQYEVLVQRPDETTKAICDWIGLTYQSEMLEYGRRERVKGRYGDPTGVGSHDNPSAIHLNSWIDHARDNQIHHLISAYLDDLGAGQVDAMGYDLNQLQSELSQIGTRYGKANLQWDHLINREKSPIERLRLTITPRQMLKHPLATMKKVGRLLAEK